MIKTFHTARCAPVAIAAILAFGSTPGAAQDAQSMPAPLPTATTAPAPSPTFPSPPIMQSPVNPEPVTATNSPDTDRRFVSDPQVQDLPEPAPSTTVETDTPTAAQIPAAAPVRSSPARTAPTSYRAAPTSPAPVADATTPATNPVDGSIANEDYLPIPRFDPNLPVATDTTLNQASDLDAAGENGMIGLLAAALAGLIPIGLAIAAVVWWRRRSRPVAAAPQPTLGSRSEPPKPVAKSEPARAPIFTRDDAPRPVMSPAVDPQPAIAASGGVALAERTNSRTRTEPHYDEPEVPSDDVRSPASDSTSARSRMIERMVDAEPDEANPFRTRKARRRRARLILASRGRGFGGATPAFG